MRQTMSQRVLLIALGGTLNGAQNAWASAAGTGLPWESVLQTFSNSLTGPVATAIALIAIAFCGFTYMTSQNQAAIRWTFAIAIGITLIVFAPTFLATFGVSSTLN